MSIRTFLTVVVLLLAPSIGSAQAVVSTDAIARAVAGASDAAILMRHQIHQNPELGNREVKTADLIASKLRMLGMEVRTASPTRA